MSTILSTGVQPRAWIGCLECYNNGRLTGDWYDADVAGLVTPEDLHGRPTSHEELWVFDHENFHGVLDGEHSPHEAAEIAEVLADLSEDETGAFAAWVDTFGEQSSRTRWVEKFREDYRGFHDDEADFTRHWFEETSSPEEVARLTEWPYRDIDWEYASHELFTGGFHAENAPGGIWVFCA
ncbi:antirestriction protein ArdA [Streptomyces sp. NPDC006984]|uniref:antirestriction protein ArdA n=1 Tax=Streptomyces sp. NPDC006984 TaxID=3155463 RepID=UPI0033C102C0